MNGTATTLLATVGGSHQPIVTAIAEAKPARVVFFCTDRDPATGRPGSRTQVEGTGLCLKAAAGDEKATLPNLPTIAKLAPDAWSVAIVPADDLDECYAMIAESIRAERAVNPAARLVADYTGGTKTMSSALVLAALDAGDVELRFVTGARADLVKVRDGTQMAAPARVDAIRLRRDMAPFLGAWTRYAYDEAAAGLARLRAPADPRLRGDLVRGQNLSSAFSAWDRFDHAEALAWLEPYASVLPANWKTYLSFARQLAGEPSARRTGLLVWDLWLNARRRADAGRYDDAVARAYRLIECTAQWVLDARLGLRTADLSPDVAAEAGIVAGRDGRFQAGLFPAWGIVGRRADGPAARFFAEQRAAMLDHLRRRNDSILAHGFTPLSRADWTAMQRWLEDAFEPMLRDELGAAGVKTACAQLPDAYPTDFA